MIVLDTNVVSELMRVAPEPAVVRWVDAQHSSELYITSITAAELLFGVERMPPGQRRTRIASAVASVLEDDFADRVIPFALSASLDYARIVAHREQLGRPIGMAAAMIAATALSVGASLFATRNTQDFADTGLSLLNPWLVG